MVPDKYLKDESPYTGSCDAAEAVKSEDDIYGVLKENKRITLRGAGTGLAGSCVPCGGTVLDISGLTGLCGTERSGEDLLFTFYAGTALSDAKAEIRRKAPGYILPQDPTEETATLGGLFSMDASGPGCLRHGSFKNCVEAVDAVAGDGSALSFRRGDIIEETGLTDDAIDLLAGTEGELFVITKITVKAAPDKENRSLIIVFFRTEEAALGFMDALLEYGSDGGMTTLSAMDYLDGGALLALSEHEQESGNDVSTPEGAEAAVYLELEGGPDTDEDLETVLAALEEAGDAEDDWAWAGTSEIENRRLKEFRHAVQEALNLKRARLSKDAGCVLPLTGIGTDGGNARPAVEYIRERADKDSTALIAHYGTGEVYAAFFSREACGFSDAADHGIKRTRGFGYGKTGSFFKGLEADPEEIRRIRILKKLFDPKGVFGAGSFEEV